MSAMTITYELTAGQPMFIIRRADGVWLFDTLEAERAVCISHLISLQNHAPSEQRHLYINATIERVYCGITTDHRAL